MEALSKAESDISFAARRLEQAFKSKNDSANIPNPVKMVRRLTALELAMVQLRKDCETIAQKRSDIVSRVIAKQNENVETVESVSANFEENLWLQAFWTESQSILVLSVFPATAATRNGRSFCTKSS